MVPQLRAAARRSPSVRTCILPQPVPCWQAPGRWIGGERILRAPEIRPAGRPSAPSHRRLADAERWTGAEPHLIATARRASRAPAFAIAATARVDCRREPSVGGSGRRVGSGVAVTAAARRRLLTRNTKGGIEDRGAAASLFWLLCHAERSAASGLPSDGLGGSVVSRRGIRGECECGQPPADTAASLRVGRRW